MARRLNPGVVHDRFNSTVRSQWAASVLGLALGVAFSVCFLTGVLSHLIQHPPGWFTWPARPAGLYRLTQGVHVATGIASIPLLLAKLWTVYPHLWRWPPVESATHAVERLSLVPLVAGSLFLLVSGVNNIALWYPWEFFFPTTHYWAAWITMGALMVHVGAKLTIVRAALRRPDDHAPAPTPGAMTRRGFVTAAFSGAGLLTLVTVGQTFRPLRRLAVLAPRDPAVGPQGFPVNKAAVEANVVDLARDPTWRLVVDGDVARRLELSRSELQAMTQRQARLPIACVEGWSATVDWEGVPVRDLLALAGAPDNATVTVESLQPRGLYRRSQLNDPQAHDADTLVALRCNGEELDLDHGFPARLIGPNRPGVHQTKWLAQLTVSA